ncbi:MAG: GNAT family N-acetyltransferase [Candidatus Heimdallarchaeota archaeon]
MAIHPKFLGKGVFSTMIRKLKEIAKENNVKKLYITHENDNLPAIITHFALGAKILYTLETKEDEIERFAIP